MMMMLLLLLLLYDIRVFSLGFRYKSDYILPQKGRFSMMNVFFPK